MSKPKKTPEKDHEELVDFDVIRENWHVYELEDDTIVRTKNTLMSIIDAGPLDEKETGESGLRKIHFDMKLLNVIYSPKHLRSSKGKVWSVAELEKFIVQRNLKFRQIKDGGRSEYRTKKRQRQIIISTRVKGVDKTSKHDQNGMPAYIIRLESEILLADKLEKKQKETKT